MRPLLTPAEMAAADQAAIDAGTPVEVLMDRAGRAVARAAIDMMGGRYGKKVVVVCGKGNNGGDGYAAARVLRREGVGVRCLAVADPAELKGAARIHHDRAVAAGVRVDRFERDRLNGVDLIVDAILGTGIRGPAEGAVAGVIGSINSSDVDVLAIDIPSGVDGSTGSTRGPAIEALVTVAMAAEKVGTAIGRGAALAGAVQVTDIGILVPKTTCAMTQGRDVPGVLPTREVDSHKRSNGSVALIAGSDGMTGAAILAARGAVRMGAGYVTVAVTRNVDAILSEALPEVLTRLVTEAEVLDGDAIENFKGVLERSDAVALGPGLGQGESQYALVARVLREVDLPLVVDADGLNVLAGRSDALVERSAPAVITPHPAELARLLEREPGSVQGDRLASARDAAERFGAVVVLKGFRSIVAHPDGRCVVNPTGGPSLATAGTGDVLTGAIAALLAAGLDPFAAAWATTYVHGVAGDLAGDVGTIAWDVAEALPDATELVRSEAIS